MSGNLRNRIAEAVDRSDTRASYDGLAVAMPKDVAQAIIDELGLTVETHAATHSKRAMTRITGAWEWNNQ